MIFARERWECRPCRLTLTVHVHTGAPRSVPRCSRCTHLMRPQLELTEEQVAARDKIFAELMEFVDPIDTFLGKDKPKP